MTPSTPPAAKGVTEATALLQRFADQFRSGAQGDYFAEASDVEAIAKAIDAVLAALSLPAPGEGEATKPECSGADDPEERCPKPPHECTCWEVELDYHPKHIRASLSTPAAPELGAVKDIADERRRQIEAEGWTAEHDDTHKLGELAAAAACYAASAKGHGFISLDRAPSRWPWSLDWWKPTNRRRDLVKAGALIVAEIERLDRLALEILRLRKVLEQIRDGYGPDHLSKYARDAAARSLSQDGEGKL